MTDSMKLHNPFLISIDTYYKTRIYSSEFFTFRYTTLNHLRVNMKHFLEPILGAEVAQKHAPFPAVVTRTEMGNANICILCDAVKKV